MCPERIQNLLNTYFPNPKIPLQHKDPYTLLISVLLSAQSTDVRVNATTPALFSLADNPLDMSKVPLNVIEATIRPIGLSRAKSKAIKALSKILVDKHEGKVPRCFKDLEALPGVGHKTASVVMSQAFHIPAFSRRYTHSPVCEALGVEQWKECQTD